MDKIKIFESSMFQEAKTEDRVNEFISNNDIIVKDIQISTACAATGAKAITVMVWYKED